MTEVGSRRVSSLPHGRYSSLGSLSPLVRESRVVSLPLGFPTPLPSLRSEALRGDDKRSEVGRMTRSSGCNSRES